LFSDFFSAQQFGTFFATPIDFFFALQQDLQPTQVHGSHTHSLPQAA
jgi:hypothetical protein